MDYYFLILAFCLVTPVYSAFEFLRYATGWTRIKCDQDSFIITNKSDVCTGSRYCTRNFKNRYFACIKNEFEKSNCDELTGDTVIARTGCYVGKDQGKIQLRFNTSLNRWFHTYLVHGEMEYPDSEKNTTKTIAAFSIRHCKTCGNIKVDGDSWIIVKDSHKSRYYFEEAFNDPLPSEKLNVTDIKTTSTPMKRTSPVYRITDIKTTSTPMKRTSPVQRITDIKTTSTPMKRTSPVQRMTKNSPTSIPIKRTSSVSKMTKNSSTSIPIKRTSSVSKTETKYRTSVAPKESHLSNGTIILMVGGIILLVLVVLLAFATRWKMIPICKKCRECQTSSPGMIHLIDYVPSKSAANLQSESPTSVP